MSDPAPNISQSAPPVPPKPVPIGDYDDSMFSHLGLPFYYRHAATLVVRRTSFWLAFIVLTAIVGFNILSMPYAKDTLVYEIRVTLFDHFPLHNSFSEAGQSLFSQLFVLAIILSGIIAPLFATFSLSSERILGTMEFLRLSPMSTLSIVMGKMFAPAYPLHIFSGGLLLLGSTIGLLSGLAVNDVCFAVMVIILNSAVLHALGAFLAVFTLTFRGFGALFFLLLIGYILSVAPVELTHARGLSYFAFASPWGTMEQLFWHDDRNYWMPTYLPMFAGYERAVTPYAICGYSIAFILLVWAASRKLDRPDRNALPVAGWLILWAAVLASGFGTIPNFTHSPIPYREEGWRVAAGMIFIGGLITCGLALLDHPHSRESVLADECERASGREGSNTRPPWRLWHALFITSLVLVTASIIVAILYHVAPPDPLKNGAIEFEWTAALGSIALAVVLALVFALLIETVAVGYQSLPARAAMTAAGMAIFLFAAFAPVISLSICYDRWYRATETAVSFYTKSALYQEAKMEPDANLEALKNILQYDRRDPDIAPYLERVASAADAMANKEKYRNPATFLWHYHRTTLLTYPSIFLSLVVLLVVWRRRNYAALRREALRAAGPPERAAQPAAPTPQLVQAV
jgi:hypothetical protein